MYGLYATGPVTGHRPEAVLSATGFRPQATLWARVQTTGHGPWATGHGPQATSHTMGHRLQATGHGLRATGHGPRPAGPQVCGPRATGHVLGCTAHIELALGKMCQVLEASLDNMPADRYLRNTHACRPVHTLPSHCPVTGPVTVQLTYSHSHCTVDVQSLYSHCVDQCTVTVQSQCSHCTMCSQCTVTVIVTVWSLDGYCVVIVWSLYSHCTVAV